MRCMLRNQGRFNQNLFIFYFEVSFKMGKEKEKTSKKKVNPNTREILRRWEKLREEVSKAWDGKLTPLEEIRAQREK